MTTPPPLPHWDLSPLYASATDAAIDRDLATSREAADAFATRYQGRVASLAPAELRDALRTYESLLATVYRPQTYAGLAYATATQDDVVRAMQTRVSERATDTHNRVRFLDVELARTPDDRYAAWLADASLAPYGHYLRRARAAAPHLLAEPVENALATKDLTGRRAWSQLYTEITSSWAFPFAVEGETRERNLAELRALRAHPDRDVRARAHSTVLDRFGRESSVFSYLINVLYQDHRLENDLRRYDSPVSPTLLDDEISRETVDALMTAVEAHYPVAQEYFRLKARALGLGRLATHDVLAPYPAAERTVPFHEAREDVLRAFGALDPLVADHARRFFDERRIDAEPRAGKRDGAFCAGMIPGVEPYVLTNYTGRLQDVLTLAHELGHGVHFSLAGERQSLLNYWPTTPMAETASVFGEMVLAKDLIAQEKDGAVRRQLLATRIEDALGTIHRQVAFTRYEMNAHARRAEGVMPVREFSALWSHEMERLYGDAVERLPHDAWGWAGIPHLVYYRFYCYSYAFGQLLVFALYGQWERDGGDFVPRYLDLLAGGGSDEPRALLARTGIDVTDPGFWQRGLDVVTRMVEDFSKE